MHFIGKFDNNIYDEFDFNQFGQHINGSHYYEKDYDYYGSFLYLR